MTYTKENLSPQELVRGGWFPSEPERSCSPLISINHFYDQNGEIRGCELIQSQIQELKDRASRYVNDNWLKPHMAVIRELERGLRLRKRYGVGIKAEA